MKQINDIQEGQKIIVEFSRKIYVWKESEVMTQGRKEVQVGTFLLANDKNKINLKLIMKNQFKVNYIKSITMNFWWAI